MVALGCASASAAKSSSETGRPETAAVGRVGERPVGAEGLQAIFGRRRVGVVPVRARQVVGLLRGADDGPVSGAAAEIAGEQVVDAGEVGLRLGAVGGPEAHHEARRAEAALRAVTLGQRGLHRVEPAVRSAQVLDGDDLAPVQHGQELDAGVDRADDHRAGGVALAQAHGAGAAVALGTALLGAGEPPLVAEPVQQRRGRRQVRDLDRGAVEQESDRFAHDAISSPDRSSSHRARAAAARGNAPPGRRCRSGSAPGRGTSARAGPAPARRNRRRRGR